MCSFNGDRQSPRITGYFRRLRPLLQRGVLHELASESRYKTWEKKATKSIQVGVTVLFCYSKIQIIHALDLRNAFFWRFDGNVYFRCPKLFHTIDTPPPPLTLRIFVFAQVISKYYCNVNRE